MRNPILCVRAVLTFSLVAACMLMTPAQAATAQFQTGALTKEHLMKLYLASLAADRCGFAITAKQADALEGATNAITTRLRLDTEDTDGLYSEADIAFSHYGAEACNRGGALAKVFGEMLAELIKP